MVGPSITYELSSKADDAELVELFREFYPHLGWSDAYLAWQYHENPAGPAQVWVARDGKKIVASYSAIPHKMHIMGRTAIGWRIQDVLTRPEYRGMGIYHALSEVASESIFKPEFPLNFSFPNERSHQGFMRTGWTASFRIPLRILSGVQSGHYENIPATVSPISHFDHHTDRIWSSYVSRFDFTLHRSSDYLNWRYLSNPRARYFPFRVTLDEDEIVLVLKNYEREDNSKWVHICDLFYSAGNLELLDCAMKHSINFAVELGAGSISCWCPSGSVLESALNRHQFMPEDSLNRWLVINGNVPDMDINQLCDETRWHLAMGDSDVF